MKQGFCISVKELKMLSTYIEKCGKKPFDFVDFSGTEICGLSFREIKILAEYLKIHQIPCLGIHASFPKNIKFIGKGKNISALEDYTKQLVDRCNILGSKIIGIGCPDSRFREENFSEEDADKQMLDTLQMISKLAEKQTVLLESIQPKETNYINSASHARKLVDRLSEYQNIGMICDIYHFYCCREQIQSLDTSFWNKVFYLHIADPNGRRYLSKNTDKTFLDYATEIVKQARQAEGIAVEAKTERITDELSECKSILQLLEGDMNL